MLLVASNDFDTAERILAWPLLDVLSAALQRVKDLTREAHERDVLLWTLAAPHLKNPPSPPKVPELLKR